MVSWQQEASIETFNLYRGDLGILRASGIYTQDPAQVPLARRDCGLTGTQAADAAVIPRGAAVFFLVSGTQSGVEGDLGEDGNGNPRRNANPCP